MSLVRAFRTLQTVSRGEYEMPPDPYRIFAAGNLDAGTSFVVERSVFSFFLIRRFSSANFFTGRKRLRS